VSEQRTILVVEDEPNLAAGLREALEAEGYWVQTVTDGLEAHRALSAGRYDLVLLDVMLPYLDGFALCERIRSEGNQTPVLFLTAKGLAEDRIKGFEAGGDDYLDKPFELKELLLRIAAILRRTAWYVQNHAELKFGDNTVDFANYQARSWNGLAHELTHKEAMILKLLANRSGTTVTREEILDHVWGYEVFPSTRTIDNFIVRLRKRFERDPERPQFIHTVHGIGYRFTAEVVDHE
jgi:two-component system alkaline phosphatase synthesis response regulator PhoP